MKRNAADRRILDGITDYQFQVEVRIHCLMADWDILKLVFLSVFESNIPRCPPYKLMDVSVAFIKFSI